MAFILNLETTHVSPQYHIVLDEGFTTCIPGSDEQNDEKYKTIFENLFKTEWWLTSTQSQENFNKLEFHLLPNWDDDDGPNPHAPVKRQMAKRAHTAKDPSNAKSKSNKKKKFNEKKQQAKIEEE